MPPECGADERASAGRFDLDTRKGRMKARDVLETEVETLRGFGEPPPPYRAVVSIPGGFEYTGEGNSAQT
jgi:hypothetical protein